MLGLRAADTGDVPSNTRVSPRDAQYEAERAEPLFPSGRRLLDVEAATIQYKAQSRLITAVYRVSFSVDAGDRFILLGPSGCGKSTLLKSIAGFIKPVEGEIRVQGRKVERPGPDRVMVFQEFDQLLPWKTVRENIMFPLLASGRCGRVEARERAERYIELVNLAKFANTHPHQLSGGMKQRVAIARAMAMEPDVLLMDEPFASLDALTRRKMQDELLRLWETVRFTLLFVTHSIEEALLVGDRVLLLSPHPGRVHSELRLPVAGSGDVLAQERERLSRHIHEVLFASTSDSPKESAPDDRDC
jgi:NitT/TauT family transport system ATP-binding protein